MCLCEVVCVCVRACKCVGWLTVNHFNSTMGTQIQKVALEIVSFLQVFGIILSLS